ncbi:SGNH/GDSL hydrolase family protein [Niabella hirudinis]|uniref:SGNH/GDSL hydrolase family protein n=1 Tax=Niabella hirudinis TaxID=1285929 RepID=UPI003EB98F0A
MKKTIWICCAFLGIFFTRANSQADAALTFVDASGLTLIGKAFVTPFPWHRVDTAVVRGMSPSENQQARCTAGLALLFRTNSASISVRPSYKWEQKSDNMTGIARAGFDLYIREGGKWKFAGNGVAPRRDKDITLVANMDSSQKDCLLYLPIYSELADLKIGIETGASIKGIDNPFKTKTIFFGSSFTQGISASRPAMSYPLQLQRNFNIDVCNLGFSGNSKLQPYFARMLAGARADAIVMDAFSNPLAPLISERLEPFLEILVRSHKDIPLIFVETIHREKSNFDRKVSGAEQEKRNTARALMKKLMNKYPNVYFIENPLPAALGHDTSADGVHPSDLGYYYWSQNLGKKLMEILKKY